MRNENGGCIGTFVTAALIIYAVGFAVSWVLPILGALFWTVLWFVVFGAVALLIVYLSYDGSEDADEPATKHIPKPTSSVSPQHRVVSQPSPATVQGQPRARRTNEVEHRGLCEATTAAGKWRCWAASERGSRYCAQHAIEYGETPRRTVAVNTSTVGITLTSECPKCGHVMQGHRTHCFKCGAEPRKRRG